MIVVQLTGGLGNQLFSYASGRGIAQQLGAELRFRRSKNLRDGTRDYRLDHFRANVEEASLSQQALIGLSLQKPVQRIGSAISSIAGKHTYEIVQDQCLGYSPGLFKRDRPLFLRGFWQSEKYFAHIESEIRRELEMVDPVREIDRAIVEKIRATESVCVHVRRGDLVSNSEYAAKIHVQDAAYFAKACQALKQSGPRFHFFVFSDDADWPRQNLSIGDHVDFMSDGAGAGRADWQDFQLMRECKHFVTANSSFSWWAAWLGSHPQKQVVVPRLWYRDSDEPPPDLIPAGWMIV